MRRINRNISIILRAERLMARRRLAVLRGQFVLYLVAGIGVALTVVMVNVAAFLALQALWSGPIAAVVVAAGNLVLTIACFVIAAGMSAERDLEPVIEMRDMALSDLEDELDAGVQEARAVAEDVRRIARDPLGTLLPGVLGPLLVQLLTSWRKPGTSGEDAEPSTQEEKDQA